MIKRKLNKKNIIYISVLSIAALAFLIAIIVFICYQIKNTNIEYTVWSNSILFNKDNEVINTKEESIIKRSVIGNYYLISDENKIYLQENPVIVNKSGKEIKLLGTFYEILKNGEVDKLTVENIINITSEDRIFKIDDRKYLIIGEKIVSDDGSLETSNFLLIDIDKVGNGYLYNDEINIKSFNKLNIIANNFKFNVNEEKLIIDEEEIDLSKINGSTNIYKDILSKTSEKDGDDDKDSENDGTGSGGSNGSGNGAGQSLYPNQNQETQEEKTTYYVNKKTIVFAPTSTNNSIKFNYSIIDPFGEYKSVKVKLFKDDVLLKTEDLNVSLSEHEIFGLELSTEYRLDFYYTYEDNGVLNEVLFDTHNVQTKGISGKITLEMISNSIVQYKVIIDDSVMLDKFTVDLIVEGFEDKKQSIEITSETARNAASTTAGYVGEFVIDETQIPNLSLISGKTLTLSVSKAFYNGTEVSSVINTKYQL